MMLEMLAALSLAIQAPPAIAPDSMLDALRDGGLVIVFRHAHTDRSREDSHPIALADRASQRNLSPRGEEEARRIGEQMRRLRIPVGEVIASPMFRTRETAQLAFGKADTSELLRVRVGSPDARRLLTRPVADANRVLVTHNAFIQSHFRAFGLGQIDEGDAIVLTADPTHGVRVLGRIRVDAWTAWSPDTASRLEIIAGPDHVIRLDAPLVEPHLAVDPTDPRRLLLGAIGVVAPGLWTVRLLRSQDAGENWGEIALPTVDRSRLSADPWVGFGPDGRAYFSHLARMPLDERRTRVGVLMHRSTNGGVTFPESRPIPWGDGLSFDHPTFGIDWTNGPMRGTVHVAASQGAWTRGRQAVYRIGVSRWAPASPAPDTASGFLYNNFNEVNGDVTVLEDGRVLYPYFEISRVVGTQEVPLASKRLWVVSSYDGGRTFSNPFLVAEDYMGQFPRLAKERGTSDSLRRVYMVWRGLQGDTAVYLSHSDDAGELWSARRRVRAGESQSDGRWRTISIAVNHEGVILLTWHQMGAAGDPRCFDVYASASIDRGETFSPPSRLSTAPSCPAAGANVVRRDTLTFDVAGRFPAGGDYGALAAAPNGEFHTVWADSRDGAYHLRHATLTVVRRAH